MDSVSQNKNPDGFYFDFSEDFFWKQKWKKRKKMAQIADGITKEVSVLLGCSLVYLMIEQPWEWLSWNFSWIFFGFSWSSEDVEFMSEAWVSEPRSTPSQMEESLFVVMGWARGFLMGISCAFVQWFYCASDFGLEAEQSENPRVRPLQSPTWPCRTSGWMTKVWPSALVQGYQLRQITRAFLFWWQWSHWIGSNAFNEQCEPRIWAIWKLHTVHCNNILAGS